MGGKGKRDQEAGIFGFLHFENSISEILLQSYSENFENFISKILKLLGGGAVLLLWANTLSPFGINRKKRRLCEPLKLSPPLV